MTVDQRKDMKLHLEQKKLLKLDKAEKRHGIEADNLT